MGAAFLMLFSVFTWARAELWGDVEKLSLVWTHENPGSIRAQQQAAIIFARRGQYAMASRHIEDAIRHHPKEPVLRLQRMSLGCAFRRIPEQEVEEAARLLATQDLSTYTLRNLENLADLVLNGKCSLTEEDILKLADAMLSHPHIGWAPGMQQALLYLKARVLASQGRGKEAEKALLKAFHLAPTPQAGMQIVGMLATLGRYQAALELLDEVESRVKAIEKGGSLKARLMLKAYDFEHEIPRIRTQIIEDMKSARRPHIGLG
ncbi:MAG: hypothetical protein D6819_08650 [Gammaproteobacteria bacterium]|nr:MAG: hypothetical protein D6819_08650 [Gammaproteobacteria bacterium]